MKELENQLIESLSIVELEDRYEMAAGGDRCTISGSGNNNNG
jgi:hypothetical protein